MTEFNQYNTWSDGKVIYLVVFCLFGFWFFLAQCICEAIWITQYCLHDTTVSLIFSSEPDRIAGKIFKGLAHAETHMNTMVASIFRVLV